MQDVKRRVLIVDDDPDFLRLCGWHLSQLGYRSHLAETVVQAVEIGSRCDPAVILLDWQLGDSNGLDLIGGLRERFPFSPVVMVTSHSSTELAVQAIKSGAFDFLEKPLDEARTMTVLAAAARHHDLLVKVESLENEDRGGDSFEGIVGRSPQMRTVFEIVRTVAPTEANVMILGESGTGKELVARAIHARSDRASRPFVALNMAAMPAELVESTLFGHEKGAFTGAEQRRSGAVEQAAGGTLFLDEIAEMSGEMQTKLLRFLQERVFRPVGGVSDLKADVRVISATNRDPAEEVRKGRLREDLYYRLHVVPIQLSPLRERQGDVELIALHALREASERYERSFRGISPRALERLRAHPWPGNVRQLVHLIERTVILHDGEEVTESMLPAELHEELPVPHMGGTAGTGVQEREDVVPLAVVERRAIEDALRVCGSVAEAARRLGISPATIYRRFKSPGSYRLQHQRS